jgi:hypothetical protein
MVQKYDNLEGCNEIAVENVDPDCRDNTFSVLWIGT